MILEIADIKRILVTNPTKSIWDMARRDSALLQMHILGIGLENHIKQIDWYESIKATVLRKKYCKTNRDLFTRLLRPIDNIWAARGGGTFLNTTEANEKVLRKMLLNVIDGYPLRKWMRSFWLPRYLDDPMGIIFIEADNDNPNGAYPTYKGSAEIFDALPSGRRLEYIVFKTDDPQIFRLVDDAKDIMVKMEGTGENAKVTLLKGKQYPTYINWFESVPAIMVSDLPKDGYQQRFTSPVFNEIELAEIFLREGSITNIYRFRHGFPKSWKYPEICGKCNGNKVINAEQCPDCKGSGVKLESKPADISVFAWPDKDNVEIKEKGGFISADLEYLKYADESLQGLDELITLTHWGIRKEKNTAARETATGRFIDIQPVNNRLISYCECEETVEAFIIDQIGYYKFNTRYGDSVVNLGRRFLIEPLNMIWTTYEDARKNGASQAALDDLLRDYYETKYQGNPNELDKSVVLMRLEPGVHLTMGEAKSNLPYSEFIKKIYFRDFVNTLSDIEIIGTPLITLRDKLTKYSTEQVAAQIVDPAIQAAADAAAAAGGLQPAPGPGKPVPKPQPQPA